MSTIHTTAASGFEAGAATYVRGRPDYPSALDGWLTGIIGLGTGTTVLDLGAGTGKFTKRLAATGAAVVAVEPVAAMRQRLAEQVPGISALDGTAEHLPLEDASVDVVICAQAFHWFANTKALAEIHRVLTPAGRLGLVWNSKDESVPWVRALFAIIEPHEGDVPRFYPGKWRSVFPARGFSTLEEVRFPHTHSGPAEQVLVDRLLSVSFIASLPEAERATVAQRIRDFARSTPELEGRSEVSVPYVTHAFTTTKLPA